jgi:hypothetical protein
MNGWAPPERVSFVACRETPRHKSTVKTRERDVARRKRDDFTLFQRRLSL